MELISRNLEDSKKEIGNTNTFMLHFCNWPIHCQITVLIYLGQFVVLVQEGNWGKRTKGINCKLNKGPIQQPPTNGKE